MLRCGPLYRNTKLIKYGAGKPYDFIVAFSCFFIFRKSMFPLSYEESITEAGPGPAFII